MILLSIVAALLILISLLALAAIVFILARPRYGEKEDTKSVNGIEAVTLNDDEHPDLILMDIRMPQMNGLDATRIIKEVNHDTPIIALSAFAFDENINEAMSAGCNEFMAKPFRVEELVEKVEKYLNKKKQ